MEGQKKLIFYPAETSRQPRLPETLYPPDQFITHKQAFETITQMIENAQPDNLNILNLVGPRGMGKGRILQSLEDHYRQNGEVAVLSLDCAQFGNQVGNQEEQQQAILQGLFAQIKEERETTTKPPTLEDFIAILEKSNLIILFLINNTEQLKPFPKADLNLIRWLQEQLIYPIHQRTKAVTVLAGQNPFYWILYRLRGAVNTKTLAPFTRNEIRNKLTEAGIDQKLTEYVYQQTQGYPAAVSALINALRKNTLDSLSNRERVTEIISICIDDQICASFPEEQRKDLKQILFAASIFRYLDGATLASFYQHLAEAGIQLPIIPSPINDPYENSILALKDAQLTHWDETRRTEVINPVVRQIVNTNFQSREPEKYRRFHAAAAKLYEERVKNHPGGIAPKGFDIWLTEWLYHSGEALEEHQRKSQRETVVAQVGQFIKQMTEAPQMQWDLSEEIKKLKERITIEKNLLIELWGENTYQEILEQIKGIRFLK